MSRQRVESLHRKCPAHRVGRDADLDGSVHEGLLADAPELEQHFLPVVGEISRPAKHTSNSFTIEEPLRHRRSAYAGA